MRKPFEIPKELDELHGPSKCVLTLPPSICWGPKHEFDLTNRNETRAAYGLVLTEGSLSKITTLVNRDLLLDVWADLFIPTYLAAAWEERFNLLKGNKACLKSD